MAQQVILDVKPRTIVGKATKRLRREGLIPANIYGHKQDSLAVQIDAIAFDRLQRGHSARHVITLRLPDGPAQTALIRHIQHNPVTGHVLHVDFSRVSLTERIEAKIPLSFVGTAPGVKDQGGVLLHLEEALPVTCRASDIIERIEVDLSPLTEIDSTLYARDITLPTNYELAIEPDEPIVKVAAPRIEVEAAPAEAAPEAAPAASESAEA